MGKKWDKVQVAILLDNYTEKGNAEIGGMINRTPGAIKKKMQELGIKRLEGDLHSIRSRLCKKPNRGHFKLGNLPYNTKHDGHERISKDGYRMMRLSVGNFKLTHLHLWEQENGPLPEGYCLRCIDGDILNVTPSNWRLITRIENMYLNCKYKPHNELIPSMVLVKQLNNKLKTIENGA